MTASTTRGRPASAARPPRGAGVEQGTGAGATIRRPEGADPALMTRRGWWLVVMNVLVPGSAQVLAGSRRLGRFGLTCTLVLWAVVAVAVALWFLARGVLLTLFTTGVGLTIVQLALAAYAVLWFVLTVDTLRLVRFVRLRSKSRPLIAGITVALLAITSGGAGYAAYLAGVARGAVGDVFQAAFYEPPVDGRYNIMLLGGDAGADRAGLRPDSMKVLSIDDATGQVTIFGLPRDLTSIPFSEGSPMLAAYPNGYGWNDTCDVDVCLLNSIYTEVTLKTPELYPDAVAEGSDPGIEAMRDAMEGALGIPIQYYVLIDMQGFEQLIDALGGVTITVDERLPIGGGVASDGSLTGVNRWVEPGEQHMDGNTALWYARSRHSTSDYDRMARQQVLLEAILQQADPVNVVGSFERIAAAGAQVVKTDIPEGNLGHFADLALKSRGTPIQGVDFVPPLIDPADPDYTVIQGEVQALLAPPAEG